MTEKQTKKKVSMTLDENVLKEIKRRGLNLSLLTNNLLLLFLDPQIDWIKREETTNE